MVKELVENKIKSLRKDTPLKKFNNNKLAEIEINNYWLKAVLENGERVMPNGEIELFVGGHQPDRLSEELSGSKCLKISVK